jgi:membrane fusion protein, copper/silver efflux system
MNRPGMIGTVLAVAALTALGYGAYRIGMDRGMKMATPAANGAAAPSAQGAEGRKVLYWHDPMVPGQRFDKPGKSPFMDMQLVPVYADEGGEAPGSVRIDPTVRQNLGVRTALVERGSLDTRVEAVGNVAFNDRDTAVVQARGNGFLEKLHVRAALDTVRAGQPLADLYIPEWVAAQEEFLSARRLGAVGPAGLADAARQRMRLAGMSEAHVARIEAEGKVSPRLTITAPIGGVVSELTAREGMTVAMGAPLFRINGLSTVWIHADVPETMAHAVRPGAQAVARTTAFPDVEFKGKVTAILPEVSAATRTLKARVEVANPGARLVPGMFAQVEFARGAAQEQLLVPSEAVIRTGTRNLVMVVRGEGGFAPVEVEVGQEAAGRTVVRRGLAAGDKVVVSGQFLVDSEASLKGLEARLAPAPAAEAAKATPAKPDPKATHAGEGRIESIGAGEVTLSHGPIPSLGWPAMTMDFKSTPAVLPRGLKAGDTVRFQTRAAGEGEYEITAMERKAGGVR